LPAGHRAAPGDVGLAGRYARLVGVLAQPPEGTIALLFTDIEGSTRLAAALGAAWPQVLAEHHALMGEAIAAEGGFVDRTEGDAFFATFVEATAAVRAAVGALRALRAHVWPAEVGEVRVRMGLHVGYVARASTGYVGLEVHRAARVASAAHGGQLLLTAPARALAGELVRTEPLGVHRLKDFPTPEPLFCAVIDGRGAVAFPPLQTPEIRPTNLPPAGAALVGREDDLERVRRALLADGDRLVTLTGRGGAGKTSLALVAATALLDDHPGGVWLVTLATVSSPDGLLPAVAAAIRAEGEAHEPVLQAVVARLRDRGPVLLVLDNLEHLLDAAPQVATLLAELPELRLLVTSQAPLHLSNERRLPLDGLDDEASLALVEHSARRSGARVGRGDRDALLDVVRLLDGLPLTLELAAARLAVLTPAQLRDRLRDSTVMLRERGGDRPERQRSLRATVDWTLGALEEDPRKLFTRMGAFAGPVALEDIEAVAGADGLDVLDALSALLDVALVRRVEERDGRVRFGLPQALRQIAADELDAAPDGVRWRRAHAERQLDIAWPARFGNMVSGDDYRAAVASDAEGAAALLWARTAGEPLAPRLAAARVVRLADLGRVREALATSAPLLEKPSGDLATDALVQIARSYVLTILDDFDGALAAAERGCALAPEDPAARAFAHCARGFLLTAQGRSAEGIRDTERASALARETGDAAVIAYTLLLEAQARIAAGELERAAEQLAEAERAGAAVDAKLLWHKDTIHGDLAMQAGNPQEALGHYVQSLISAESRNDELQVLFDLLGVANGLATLHHDAEALEVTGLAEALTEHMSGTAAPSLAEHLLGHEPVAHAEERLGADAVERCKAIGQAQAPARRVARACELARLAATG
jgi:class 3 adenylate cyclase/predicted ATPase